MSHGKYTASEIEDMSSLDAWEAAQAVIADEQTEATEEAFTLTVALGNAGMLDGEDVAPELQRVAEIIEDAERDCYGTINDRNGNKVGEWKLSLPKETHHPGKTWTLAELEALPTISQGQADDLRAETPTERVWLSRCSVADGEPFDNAVTVERLTDGRWIEIEKYEAT